MMCSRKHQVCPVVREVEAIYGSGLYTEEAPTVIIGGDSHEMVYDEASYHITVQRMEYARFELSNPSTRDCAAKYKKSYADVEGLTYKQLYKRLVDSSPARGYVRDTLTRIVDLIGSLERTIIKRVEAAARSGQSINITLPDIMLSPYVDTIIMYRPDVLHNTMNEIIDYVNRINVNSIANVPPQRIEHLPEFTDVLADITVPELCGHSASEIMEHMRVILSHETAVAEYARKVEQYHCAVISRVGSVFEVCKKIIDGMSTCGSQSAVKCRPT